MSTAPIGIIGGTGLYELLGDCETHDVDTPYGRPSDALVTGLFKGRRVAFLPRHGRDHRHPPHRINYRANLWALASAGVEQILAPCAVGALGGTLPPGSLVVPDQVVDRTTGRASTFYDEGDRHVSFADPYCPTGRAAVCKTAAAQGVDVVDGGTMVVIQGPRFSSRAESRWYAAQGWTLVNMTGLPEAALARELALCYTSIAIVTDVDAGVDAAEAVTHAEVKRVFAANIARVRTLLGGVAGMLTDERPCRCPGALDGP